MDRDDLVERVAKAIHMDQGARIPWEQLARMAADHPDCMGAKLAASLRNTARAAVAIIEPAVREACALEADGAGCGRAGTLIAAAIRAGDGE